MKIVIIDYGTGNLMSISSAIKKVGYQSEITDDKTKIKNADRIILPGVGAFKKGMENLKKKNLIETLSYCYKERKVPILGVCLGFQLMAKKSYEFGDCEGLGWLNAEVKKFSLDKDFPIPHMGWNKVEIKSQDPIFKQLHSEEIFFFANSYFVQTEEKSLITSTCKYGIEFASSIRKKNLVGVQFHPEKSQATGLLVYKNFIEKYAS